MENTDNNKKDEEKQFNFLDRIDRSSINTVENRPFDIEELKRKINRAE